MPPVEEWETFPFDGEMRPRGSAAAGGGREAAPRRGRSRLPRLRQGLGRPDLGRRALAADRARADRAAARPDSRAEGALRHRDAAGRARGGAGPADAADRAGHPGGRRHRPRARRPLGRGQRAPALVVHGPAGPDAAAERQLRGDLGRHPAAGARGRLARDSQASPPRSVEARQRQRHVRLGQDDLRRELAGRLDVPYVELDALHHGPNWTEASAGGVSRPRARGDGRRARRLGDRRQLRGRSSATR